MRRRKEATHCPWTEAQADRPALQVIMIVMMMTMMTMMMMMRRMTMRMTMGMTMMMMVRIKPATLCQHGEKKRRASTAKIRTITMMTVPKYDDAR